MKKTVILVFSAIILTGLIMGCATSRSGSLTRDAVLAYRTGDVDKFKSNMKEAHEIDPEDPYVLNNMGFIYEMEGKKAEALSHYKEAAQKAGNRTVDVSQVREQEGRQLKDVATENYQRLEKK